MQRPRTGTIIISGASVLILLAAGTTAGAAIAAPVDGSGVMYGCYTNKALSGSHVFVLQDAGTTCPQGTTAIKWNQTGPQGPAGPAGDFTGHFASPNRLFSLDVTDTGIVMTGPGGSVTINSGGVSVQSTSVTIDGATGVAVKGGFISLNGCRTGLARGGDTIDTCGLTVSPAGGPVNGSATINQGSPWVRTG